MEQVSPVKPVRQAQVSGDMQEPPFKQGDVHTAVKTNKTLQHATTREILSWYREKY